MSSGPTRRDVLTFDLTPPLTEDVVVVGEVIL